MNTSIPYTQENETYFEVIEDLGRANIHTEMLAAISKGMPIITFMKIGWTVPIKMEVTVRGSTCFGKWLGT